MIFWILLLATILRLITLNQSLWFDEANNVLNARDLSFWHFVTGYSMGDFHPPGYFGLLWVWSHLFGFSEVAVRLPSVILGVASVWLTFLLGKDLFNKRVGLFAAFFIALGPLDIYYSQEARMYSLAAFAVTLSFYLFHKLIIGQQKYLPFYLLSVALVLYSDYLAYFGLLAQAIYLVIFNRERWKTVSLGWVGGLLLWSPWLLVFPQQLEGGRQTAQVVSGWAKVVGGADLKNVGLVIVKTLIGRVSFANKFIYALVVIPVVAFYGWILWAAVRKFDQATKLLLIWLILPVITAFAISFFIPIFAYFRMIFILPAFYLLLGVGVNNLTDKSFKVALTGATAVALVCIGAYYINPAFQREDWRGLAKFISRIDPVRSVVFFENGNLPPPYRYYDKKIVESYGALTNFPVKSIDEIVDIGTISQGKENIYLVDYLVDISDPQRLVAEKLTDLGYRKTKTYDFPSLGFVYLYAK